MKRQNPWALVLSMLMGVAAVTEASAQQQMPSGPGMMQGQGSAPGMRGGRQGMMQGGAGTGSGAGPGMMGPGMMGGYGMSGIWSLDLTDQQTQQIGEIMAQQRKQQWEHRARMQEAMAQLNRLYANETPNPEKVGEVYARLGEAQGEMAESQVRANNSIWKLLTDQQRQQIRGQAWRGQP